MTTSPGVANLVRRFINEDLGAAVRSLETMSEEEVADVLSVLPPEDSARLVQQLQTASRPKS
jgi:hypothetical protein